MKTVYRENRCPHCSFNVREFDQEISGITVKFVDCQRDNTDAEKLLKYSSEAERLLAIRQGVELRQCIYDNEDEITEVENG